MRRLDDSQVLAGVAVVPCRAAVAVDAGDDAALLVVLDPDAIDIDQPALGVPAVAFAPLLDATGRVGAKLHAPQQAARQFDGLYFHEAAVEQ